MAIYRLNQINENVTKNFKLWAKLTDHHCFEFNINIHFEYTFYTRSEYFTKLSDII